MFQARNPETHPKLLHHLEMDGTAGGMIKFLRPIAEVISEGLWAKQF
jgi:hypothetical protein